MKISPANGGHVFCRIKISSDARISTLYAYNRHSVKELWSHFTLALQAACSKFIPTKTARSKDKFPWIDSKLIRLYRKRDRQYKKMVKTKQSKDRENYLKTKHLTRIQTKQAYKKYLEDILNVNQNQETSTQNPTLPYKPNTKKLYTLLKHSKQDSASVAPLNPIPNRTAKTARYCYHSERPNAPR